MLRADLNGREGRDAVQEFFARLVPGLKSAPTLVHAPSGHFMDKPDTVISCINLATVRALEADWGHPVHPLRFRANSCPSRNLCAVAERCGIARSTCDLSGA